MHQLIRLTLLAMIQLKLSVMAVQLTLTGGDCTLTIKEGDSFSTCIGKLSAQLSMELPRGIQLV